MAAALVVLADELATSWIFKDGKALTIEEISEFLKTNSAVSLGERGYDFVCGWVAQNVNRFNEGDNVGEVYGIIDEDAHHIEWAYINAKKFREVTEDAGISSSALLSWLKQRGLIQFRGKRATRGKRIKGVNTECVVMKLLQDEPEYDVSEEIIL